MTRALILGLDGATYTVLDSLIEQGVMPNLARLMQSGVRGILQSTVPPLTPVAWSSLVTGRTPGNHGITGFFQFESPQTYALRITSSRELHAETIWSMVNRHGMRAGCLNFPIHCPPPRVDGYVVPGWLPWKWVRRFSHPIDLLDRLSGQLDGLDIRQLAMDFDQERKSIAGVELENPEEWINLHIRRDQEWFRVFDHQLQADPCEVAGIVFDGVDKLQHLLWTYLDPALQPPEADSGFFRVRDLCRAYFRQLDHHLGELCKRAGLQCSVFIVSDHGFTETRQILHINAWLERQGYLVWKSGQETITPDCQELEPEFYQLNAFDMEQTQAFALTASSNGIHIVTKGVRTASGIDPSTYERFRDELKNKLLTELKDPDTGLSLVTKAWTREEAFEGPAIGLAPDLTLELRDHGFFSVRRSSQILTRRATPMGTHHPDGVFIATGPNIQKSSKVAALRLVDVAPTLLYSLGLPIPGNLDGRVAEAIFTEQHQQNSRPQRGEAATATVGAEKEVFVMEKEDEDQVLERLRALGYIE